MSPSSFTFLSLAPISSPSTAAAPRRPSQPLNNPFLTLSPTMSPPLSAASPSSSRSNSIDFLSLAPISSTHTAATAAPAAAVATVPKDRRSSSIKSDTSLRFLKLSPVHNGRGDDNDFAVVDA